MPSPLRIATFNLENLDDSSGKYQPTLAERIAVLKPQLLRLRPDVLCLQEVNGQELPDKTRDLLALKELLKGTELESFHLESTKTKSTHQVLDERNLVILSRYPILECKSIKHDFVDAPGYRNMTGEDHNAKNRTWERPIFYACIQLPARKLHVINLHLKSKIATDIPGEKEDRKPWNSVPAWAEGYFISSMKRVGQAIETRFFLDKEIFDKEPDPWIAVCGDFNADAGDVPVMAICGDVSDTENPALVGRMLIPCERTVPEPSRYSLLHQGQRCMFDHVIVSRTLLAHYRGTEVHNELLHDESLAFKSDKLFPESDHAPVVAEFALA